MQGTEQNRVRFGEIMDDGENDEILGLVARP